MTVTCPAKGIVIIPPHWHTIFESELIVGEPPIKTVGEFGIQDVNIGMHGAGFGIPVIMTMGFD